MLKDIARAEKVLDEDHFGLEKVKERIVEYLAVQQRVDKLRGPILCLVGPPGVGKTSLGQSIARSTNRKFVRMSLGGVRDEAEIRGHRCTGTSAPCRQDRAEHVQGRRTQPAVHAGRDRQDVHGLPRRPVPRRCWRARSGARTTQLNDHYLEVDLDLSEVMFVCTANSLNIPAPLLDRMEVIRLPGYTEDEKMNIGRRYLVPKQMKNNGLRDDELKVSDSALLDIVRHYTREAGVRNLEREVAKIGRKAVKQLLLDTEGPEAGFGHTEEHREVPGREALPLR